MRKFTVLFFSLLFLWGCNNRNDSASVVINVPNDPDTLFENNVAEYYVIRLETSNASILSSIHKIRILEEEIFVFDFRLGRLSVFDKNGKFLRNIGRAGRGPGEYIQLINFEVDYNTNELLLVDVSERKVLIYSPEGKFKKTVRIENLSDNVARLRNGSYVLNYGIGDLDWNESYVLAICDPQGNVLSRHVKNDVLLPFDISAKNSLFPTPGGSAYFMPQFNNAIYSVSQKGGVTPLVEFKFDTNITTLKDVAESGMQDAMDYPDFIEGRSFMTGEISCSDKYICALIINGLSSSEWIIYDRESEDVRRFSNSLFGSSIFIDNDGYFWAVIYGDDMTKLGESWSEGDNPSLIRYKLKDF